MTLFDELHTYIVLFINFFRRRLYSWRRSPKHLPQKCKYESKGEIAGTATIAFSPDLKWFQGSIVNETKRHMVYSITGRLRRDSNTANEEQEQAEQELTGLDITGPQLGSSAGSLSSDGDQLTPPSEADSLDSDLVRVAMENFGLEDEELAYTVSIVDHETGTNHALKVNGIIIIGQHPHNTFFQNVYCSMLSDVCSLSNDDLSFSSSGRFKGAGADMVIQRNIGTSLTKNNMVVFQVGNLHAEANLEC